MQKSKHTNLQSHVEVAVVLEGVGQLDDEGAVEHRQDVALVDGVLDLLHLDNLLLLENLERESFVAAALSDQQNLAKGSGTQCLEQLILVEVGVAGILRHTHAQSPNGFTTQVT